MRRRLTEYYADEGRDDPVRLELPRGSYSVVSTARTTAATQPRSRRLPCCWARCRGARRASRSGAQPAPLAAGSRRARGRRVVGWRSRVIVLQQLEVVRWPRVTRHAAPAIAAQADGKPPIVVTAVRGSRRRRRPRRARGDADARRSCCCSTARTSSSCATEAERRVRRRHRRRRLCLERQRPRDGRRKSESRLVSCRAEPGTQIWSAAYDEPLDCVALAGGPATRRAPHRGGRRALRADFRCRSSSACERSSADALTTRDCVLKYYEYRRVLDRCAAQRGARLLRARNGARAGERRGVGRSVAAVHRSVSVTAIADPARGRAARAARAKRRVKAMDIDGDNLHANLALGHRAVLRRRRFPRRRGARAADLARKRRSPGFRRRACSSLSGETARGRALVERAIEWTPKAPSGYHASTLRSRRCARSVIDDALAAALRIDSPDWAIGHARRGGRGGAGRPDRSCGARQERACWSSIRRSRSRYRRSCGRWRVEPVLAERARTRASRQPRVTGRRRDGVTCVLRCVRGKLVDQGSEARVVKS